MDLYSLLREIADSWGLLTLTVIFLGVIAFAFRPGSRRLHADIASIPLRNDTLPAATETPSVTCCGDCQNDCAAAKLANLLPKEPR